MYPPPSDQFLATLVESHTPVTVVQLHRADGTVVELEHTAGSVTVDRSQAVRRTASVTVPDTSLIPRTPDEQLAIYGARLRIERGIRHGDGHVEMVPAFWGRLDSADGDPDYGPVEIRASGLEAVVADDKFVTAYSTRGGTSAVTAITGLIQGAIPGAVVTNYATDQVIGVRTWDAEGDRWAAAVECATAIGAELYADADGQFVIAELPDMLTAPISWTVDAGERGALVSASRGYSRDGMYNYVLASGENAEEDSPPVSAYAADEDPTSPTYIYGAFGRVPTFYSSATLTTTNLAQAAANKLLRDSLKPNATADLSSVPNPCLEPGDILRVTYGSGDRDLLQVESFSLDLVGGDFTVQCIGGREDS
ncbi:DUF5047 domain-containing protein [Streptomyces axinellae]|uniref:DUF5047 domain-containing protein n=1 Tax=Streptomyces axinellae TaxID=552788 RepID=A0ABN3QLW7_9ACTN